MSPLLVTALCLLSMFIGSCWGSVESDFMNGYTGPAFSKLVPLFFCIVSFGVWYFTR